MSGLGLLMGKFCQFWTDHTSVLTFPDDKWIVTKLGLCIDIMEIWVEIVNRQISSMLTYICPPHDSDGILSFHVLISLKLNFRREQKTILAELSPLKVYQFTLKCCM